MIARAQLLGIYRKLVLIRRFAESGGDPDPLQFAASAIVAAVADPLDGADELVSPFGQTAHRLARGAEPQALIAAGASDAGLRELDEQLRFTCGAMDRAVALARTALERDDRAIVCCTFGDELLAAGAFHEAMNEAANQRLPIVFVCANNFYGMGTLFDGAICQEDLYRFAAGYKMPTVRVDGTQLLEVHAAATTAIAHSRAGEGPSLIDAVTYHPRGFEPAGFRSPHEENILRDRDPLKNFRARILEEHPDAAALLDQIDLEGGTAASGWPR